LTISRRRRKVAVMVVQLFSIPPFTFWRMLKYKLYIHSLPLHYCLVWTSHIQC
jgi:hypothetical protein